ncbi:MAG: TonB-dependent receptor [Pyrinomonadaceae bacterium]
MKTVDCRFLVDLSVTAVKAERRRYPSALIAISVLLLIFQFAAPVTTAQTTTSTIEGTVTDSNGSVIAGATVTANGETLAVERTATSNDEGFYRLAVLPAGNYSVVITQAGFSPHTTRIELTLNRVVTLDIQLQVGTIAGDVDVTTELPLLESNASSIGSTITPQQIRDLPVNGRAYLDLLQLVPGVAINRQANPDSDNANPVLGERSGNNNFFIDGHANKDTVNGGPGAQFNQETIAEFQVLTTGYKAEFGQASGAIINVITKSGGNGFHGVGSLFYRNDAFDSSNSLDSTQTEAPHLRRYDYSLALGGPIIKNRVFFFGSAERITEDRQLNFVYPDLGTDAGAVLVEELLRAQEDPFNNPTQARETRVFFKLNEQFGQHQLSQEVNYTNGLLRDYLPLAASQNLPSSRNDSGDRRLLLAFGDTMLLGAQGDPWIVTLRGAYRGEPSDTRPSHPEAGPGTAFNPFSVQNCAGCIIFGDLPAVSFGNVTGASNLDQNYTSFTANANKLYGDHDLKFGWNFLRTKVDGISPRLLQSQIFSTVADFAAFGPIYGRYFSTRHNWRAYARR